MEKNRNIRLMLMCLLIVIVLGITIAFASLSTSLTFNGSATADGNWDIYFSNLSSGVVSGSAKITTEAGITNSTSITGLNASFSLPGDSVSYTFKVINGGNINAKLESIEFLTPTCEALGDATESDVTSVCNHFINGSTLRNETYKLEYTDNEINGSFAGKTVAVYNSLSNTDVLKGSSSNESNEREIKLTITYNDIGDETTLIDDVKISNLGFTLTYTQE